MTYLKIGKIVNTHGIKGELRVLSDFEFKDKVFKSKMTVYIGKDKTEEVIVTYRHHKIFEMITLEGYTNINEVLKYKGLDLFIDANSLKLGEDEYLDTDLIGLKVLSSNDLSELGVITNVRIMAKGNKLLEIEDKGIVSLIPYQKEFINKVDIKKKEIVVKTIPGLLK
ncbi:MAG: ribosome maturation factor RimM [Bacilli bacterium]